jgi:hypothetical protein
LAETIIWEGMENGSPSRRWVEVRIGSLLRNKGKIKEF